MTIKEKLEETIKVLQEKKRKQKADLEWTKLELSVLSKKLKEYEK